MQVLLHVCCAPCSIVCIDTLRREGIEPVGYWYNPNIHPMKEFKMRKNTMVEYAKTIGLKLALNHEYGLRRFLAGVPDFDHRCGFCYALRFDETARFAAENGFTHFTSTLFVSPYQDHELMHRTARAAAKKHGIEYLERDFSPRFREGQDEARALGLYMQNYCGCIFSEEDRYKKRKKNAQTAQDADDHKSSCCGVRGDCPTSEAAWLAQQVAASMAQTPSLCPTTEGVLSAHRA